MGKSAAEKMRDYRKRLKEDPERYSEYLAKAKKRKKNNYVPVNQLNKREKQRRREKNKSDVRAHRIRKMLERVEIEQANTSLSESGYETRDSRLVVNMQFPRRRNGPRKRMQRALSKKNRENKELQLEVENLRKKYRKTLKRLQRVKRKDKHHTKKVQDEILVDSTNHTPKRKTDALILSAGLTKNQSEKVRKQLLFANIVQTELKKNRRRVKRGERGILSGLIGGKIISKYKLARSVNKSTGLGRTTLGNGSKQPEHLPGLSNRQQRKRRREIQKHQSLVMEFLTRDAIQDATLENKINLKSTELHSKQDSSRTI